VNRKVNIYLERIAYGFKLMIGPFMFSCMIGIFLAILARGIMLQIHYPLTDFQYPPLLEEYFGELAIGIPFIIIMFFTIKREVKINRKSKANR
jgi:hypothetical protein